VTGAPRIIDPLVAFDCKLAQSLRYGSHHVFFGEVEDIYVHPAGNPLIYANRAYGRTARLEPRAIAAGGAGPALTIGALVTLAPYVVPELVRRLLDAVPGLEVKLVEATQTGLVDAIKAGTVDVAITYGFQLDPAFETEVLTEMPAYVLLPDGHRLAQHSSVAIADLAVEPMILLDLPMSRDYFLGLFTEAGVEPRIALRSTSFETVRGLVGQGLGFALLGTKPANGVTYDGMALVTRPLAGGSPASEIVMACAPSRPETAPVSMFKGICRDWLSAAD
jgi:DNA-binding transcriptional LysR family regulator